MSKKNIDQTMTAARTAKNVKANATTKAETKKEETKKVTPKAETKKVEEKKEPKAKRMSIKDRMFQLFEDKGIDKVTYEMAEAEAKKIKPETAFKPNHLAWYRGKYKQENK